MKIDGKPAITAWFSCTAGYGKTCNHVIAVLYKVEYAIVMSITNLLVLKSVQNGMTRLF